MRRFISTNSVHMKILYPVGYTYMRSFNNTSIKYNTDKQIEISNININQSQQVSIGRLRRYCNYLNYLFKKNICIFIIHIIFVACIIIYILAPIMITCIDIILSTIILLFCYICKIPLNL